MRHRAGRARALKEAFLGALGLLATLAGPAVAETAEHLGSYTWRPGWHGAGGYSALWLDEDGASFVALSDRGRWVRGVLSRDDEGAVADVAVSDRGTLRGIGGAELPPGRGRDAEGIARTGGAFVVSFEGDHRVVRYDPISGPAIGMPRPRAWRDLLVNSGFEALAAAPDGTLLAIVESNGGRDFPVWRFDGESWAVAFDLSRDGRFTPVGADVGPDGRLYVLDRAYELIGFRSRLRSLALDGSDERELMRTPLRRHDNLEGLSVWRGADGRLRATMISDDNLRAFQVTEFVDYVLED